MNKKGNAERDGLKELLRYSEDVEEFRSSMDDYWRDRRVLARLRPGERMPLRGGPCDVLLKELVPALHRHGYIGELATLSDAVHALEFYEQSRTHDPLGIALADAVFCATRLADSPLDPSDAETLLWRLCYRLSYRAWLELDARQAVDRKKHRDMLAGKRARDWDKKAAIAYVAAHARREDGRLKSKAQLSREIYPYLRQRAAETGQRFDLASLGDGMPTERALKTIQGWFSKKYAEM